MSRANVTVDTRELDQAMQRYQKLTKKKFADIANKKLYFILARAQRDSYQFSADAQDIEQTYGPRIRINNSRGRNAKVRRRHIGKLSQRVKSAIHRGGKGNPFAIWYARERRRGNDYVRSIPKREVTELVKTFVGRRYGSINYQVSGFNDALRKLARAARLKSRHKRGPKAGNQRSYAYPARAKGSVVKRLQSLALYRLTHNWGPHEGKVDPRIERAIQDSINQELRETRDRIAEKELEQARVQSGL